MRLLPALLAACSLLFAAGCYERFGLSPDGSNGSSSLDTQLSDTDGDDTDDTQVVVGTEPLDGIELFEWVPDELAERYPEDTRTGQTPFQWLNPEELQAIGVRLAQFKMTAAHPGQYQTTDGEEPVFYVVYPDTPPAGPAPVLVWLHGGVVGIVGDPIWETACTRSRNIMELLKNALINHDMVMHEIAQRGWVLVVPENTWCDLWSGLGPNDPYNTELRGLEHVGWILDALEAGLLSADFYEQFNGQEGYDSQYLTDTIAHMVAQDYSYPVAPGEYYAWGTSIGGAGVMPAAYGDPEAPIEFAGIIADSGPHQYTTWYEIPEYTQVMTWILGGSAEQFPQNYARVDGGMLIEDLGFRVPTFLAYNTYDDRTPLYHGTYVHEKLNEYYPPDDARYFGYDFNHLSPGRDYHTQTTPNDNPPWTYTINASMRFLDGEDLAIVEAEQLCTPGTCVYDGEYYDDRDSADDDPEFDYGQWNSRYSQGRAVTSACSYCTLYCGEFPPIAGDSIGGDGELWADTLSCDDCSSCADAGTTLFSGALPDDIPRGIELDLMFVMEADGITGVEPLSPFLTIELSQDGLPIASQSMAVGDMADPAGGTLNAYVGQLEASTISDITLPEGEVTATLTFEGNGAVWFDAIWAAWPSTKGAAPPSTPTPATQTPVNP